MILNCPACGSPHDMNDQYLSLYGGQQTVCRRCGAPMLIPQFDVAGGFQGGPQDTRTAWQDGKRLVILDNAPLPDRCIKCNETANGYRWKKKAYWANPLYALLVLIALPLYIIVYLVVRKKALLAIPLCARHRSTVVITGRLARWFAIVGLAALIGPIAASPFMGRHAMGIMGAVMGLGVLLGLVLLVASVVLSQFARTVYVTKMENGYIWLKGAKAPFLMSLSNDTPFTGGFEVLPVSRP